MTTPRLDIRGASLLAAASLALWLFCPSLLQAAKPARQAPVVLLEAEQFASLGGWLPDQ